MKSELKYVIYTRKSQEDIKRQVQSIDDQSDWCKEIAQKNHLKVIKSISDKKTGTKPFVRD